MTRNITLSLFAALTLSGVVITGCASTPDPAKVCTSEWIAPRTDTAISRIEKRAKSSIKSLNKASKSWVKGDKPGLMTMYKLSSSLKSLEKELTTGQGIKDLRMLAKTCNDPKIVTDSVRTMFKRQGLSDRFITFIENNPIYQRIMGDVLDDGQTQI